LIVVIVIPAYKEKGGEFSLAALPPSLSELRRDRLLTN